jgi:hypothetical protein
MGVVVERQAMKVFSRCAWMMHEMGTIFAGKKNSRCLDDA